MTRRKEDRDITSQKKRKLSVSLLRTVKSMDIWNRESNMKK
jgi:hypothetical protein